MSRRLRWAIALACAALALTAVPASAQWRPITRQCLSATDTLPGCNQRPGFLGTWNLVVSPNGRSAYSASWHDGAIHTYTRNTATGVLTDQGCLSRTNTVLGCTQGAPGLARPDEIVVSANGKNVYVTSDPEGFPGAVVTFNRNTTTGALTFASCVADSLLDTVCPATPHTGGRGAVLSGDQKNLYVAGNDFVAQFNRDLTTGALTWHACYGQGCGADFTDEPSGRQLAISPDGKQLYAPIFGPNAGLRVFTRNTTNGDLTNLGCITRMGGNGCSALTSIGPDAENVVLSPGGANLYLAHDDGIVTFRRNGNGTLSFGSCISDDVRPGCVRSANAQILKYMDISPDGQDLLAVPQGEPGGFTIFRRNASTGALVMLPSPDGCLTRDGRGVNANGQLVERFCRSTNAVSFFGHIHFFGNGLIYAGFLNGDIASVFKRDFYPVCTSRSVTAPRGRATAIPLTCSDRNGDAITRIVRQAPAAGTLGAINQAAQSVFYSPFSGFSGSDSFLFSGVAAGLTGPAARVSITVPKPKPKHIRGITLSFGFAAFTDHTVLSSLAVKHVPKRSKVTAGCVVHRHKCPGKARKGFTKKRARGTVNLKKRYVGVNLPVGATITIRVTKKGQFGAAKILKIRSRKAPKITSRCMRPGSGKLRKRC